MAISPKPTSWEFRLLFDDHSTLTDLSGLIPSKGAV